LSYLPFTTEKIFFGGDRRRKDLFVIHIMRWRIFYKRISGSRTSLLHQRLTTFARDLRLPETLNSLPLPGASATQANKTFAGNGLRRRDAPLPPSDYKRKFEKIKSGWRKLLNMTR
jgi:hypothetical protein